MDFAFTAVEDQFRADLRAFLATELPAWWRGMFVDDPRAMPFTRELCRKLARRGWLTMAWPREHGGADASPWMQQIVREEMWAHDEPRGPQYMNLNYIGPCIMRFGSAAQRARFLPPMAAGDVLWTQGFSEPGAGSDLAAVSTRAQALGEGFVVTGQKIWNSYADAPADWCFLLARTSHEAKRHQGLSILLVDMRTPGITVRPIASMAGPHELNEIVFDEVAVPADCLLGAEGQGWEIATAGLTFERVGIARYARAGRVIELLVDHVRAAGCASDPDVRRELAMLRVAYEAARLLTYRAIALQTADPAPAVETSIARLHNAQIEQQVADVGLAILGLTGLRTADDPAAPLAGLLHRQWTRTIPTTITAGTLEIQKNIIAERGLGLPRVR